MSGEGKREHGMSPSWALDASVVINPETHPAPAPAGQEQEQPTVPPYDPCHVCHAGTSSSAANPFLEATSLPLVVAKNTVGSVLVPSQPLAPGDLFRAPNVLQFVAFADLLIARSLGLYLFRDVYPLRRWQNSSICRIEIFRWPNRRMLMFT